MQGNRFYDLFTQYGVEPLYPGVEIRKGTETIWVKTNPYVAINEMHQEIPQEHVTAKEVFNEKYESEAHPFTIEVSHRPAEIDFEDEDVHDYRTNTLGKTDEELIDWDLSINGHTHGGQISLLFIGSIVSQNHGFFLGKVNVRGVHSQNGHIHYVCPRLGVSGPKFAWFCLLNTPAVGLITFKKSN